MAKLVDARDLKSLEARALSRFESGCPHQNCRAITFGQCLLPREEQTLSTHRKTDAFDPEPTSAPRGNMYGFPVCQPTRPSIFSRFRFSPKIWTAAIFDSCNTIEG